MCVRKLILGNFHKLSQTAHKQDFIAEHTDVGQILSSFSSQAGGWFIVLWRGSGGSRRISSAWKLIYGALIVNAFTVLSPFYQRCQHSGWLCDNRLFSALLAGWLGIFCMCTALLSNTITSRPALSLAGYGCMNVCGVCVYLQWPGSFLQVVSCNCVWQ